MKNRAFLVLIFSIFIISLVSAQEFELSSDNPKRDVSVDNEKYSVELVSATDSVAVIEVSQMKEISEFNFLTINGVKMWLDESDETNLKLFTEIKIDKAGELKIDLNTDEPKKEFSFNGKQYVIELVSTNDLSATIKVSDNSGKSETKEINEKYSQKINGLTISIANADETNFRLSVSIIVEEISKIRILTDSEPKKEISINGEIYTIKLVSATDNAATFKVSQMKEITEGSFIKIGKLNVNLKEADETNLKISASLVIGTSETPKEIPTETGKIGDEQYKKLLLTSDNPISGVIINSKSYKIELLSATDNSANIKVTNSEGRSEMKEISESSIG